ncbi:MAG TPA: hypothetical protein VKN63_00940 [Afifellaceae bacterium]|nr:hypothetical protein [Afifellaceae bacterium]
MFSSWQIWSFVVTAIFFAVPLWKLYSRSGFSGLWSLFAFIPFGAIVLLWVIAFIRWPNAEEV